MLSDGSWQVHQPGSPVDAPWPSGGIMAALVRSQDWSQSALGAIALWPQSLKTSVDLVLGCHFPMVLLWGPDLIQIYNDGYCDILGPQHPASLGRPLREGGTADWSLCQPLFERVWRGETLTLEDQLRPVTRNAGREDAYFTMCYSPVRDEAGQVAGILISACETTARIRADRERQHIEAALRHGEQRFRALVSASSCSVYRMSPDWSEMRQWEGKGFLPDTREPSTAWLEKYVDPGDRPLVLAAIDRAIRARSLFELEHRVRCIDGSLGWILSRAVPVLDSEGEIVEWFGVASDVTQRRDMEERQAYLLRLGDALRGISDPVEVQVIASRLLGQHLGACRVSYGETAPDGESIDFASHYTAPGFPVLAGRIRLKAFASALSDALQQGRILVVGDLRQELELSPEERSRYIGQGIVAMIGVPLVRGGRSVALLGVHHPEPHPWSGTEVFLVRETAERTWAAVERARVEKALRHSERNYQEGAAEMLAVVQSMSDGVFIGTHEGMSVVNQAALDQLGYSSREELQGDIAALAEETQSRDAETGGRVPTQRLPFLRALRGERVVQEVIVKHRLTHEERVLRCAASPVTVEGQVVAAVVVNTDITDRRRAEEQLRQAARLDAFRVKLADALRPLADAVEIQTAVTRVLGEHLQIDRAFYGRIEARNGTEYLIVDCGYSATGTFSSSGRYPLTSLSQIVYAQARQGQTLEVTDIETDPRHNSAERAFYRALNTASYIGVPLVKDGKLVGCLGIHHSIPRHWTPEEVTLAEETADRTWAAVERALSQESLRRSEERQAYLLRLSDALRPVADALDIQREATSVLGRHLGVNRVFYAEVVQDSWVIAGCFEQDIPRLLPGPYSSVPFGPWILATYRRGERIVFRDVQTDPRFQPSQRDIHLASQIVAAVGIPLVKRGELVGVLVVNTRTPRDWTEDEIELTEATAERIWAAVERARAEEALRKSDEKYRLLFNSIDEGFCIIELATDREPAGDFWLREVNRSFERQTGLFNVIGKSIREVLPRFEQRWIDLAFQVADTGEPQRSEDFVANLGRWYSVYYSRVGDSGSRQVAIVLQDITARKQAEAALLASDARKAFLLRLGDGLRTLTDPVEIQYHASRLLAEHLQASRALYVEVDGEAGQERGTARGQYTRACDPVPARFSYSSFARHVMANHSRGEILVVADVAADAGFDEQDRATWNLVGVRAAIAVRLVKGTRLLADFAVHSATPRAWTEEEITLVREVAERTWEAVERARAEAALRESQARLAAVFETLPVGIGVISVEGSVTLSNREMHRYLPTGVMPSRDDVQARRWQSWHSDGTLLPPTDYPSARASRGEWVVPGMEMLFQQDDGTALWTQVAAVPICDAEGRATGVVMTVTDIDALKRATDALRASEERFRLLVDNVQEYALFQTDPLGRVTSWNPGAERLFGYATAEMLGQPASCLMTPEDQADAVMEREIAGVLAEGRRQVARWMMRKDGTRFWAQWVTEPVHDQAGRLRGVVKVLRDETERRQADELIRRSLADKEALLKEVHHRVKNNLQVITSMLNLQAHRVADNRILAIFDETRNRVFAIAAIHELLYRSASFAEVVLVDYARQLAPELIRFYQLGDRVRVHIQGEPATVEIQRAVPFGLLLNELVSNACKHAFPENLPGTLSISVHQRRETIVLVVTDNGIGVPPDFQYESAPSLGLKLVRMLASQIGGSVTMTSQGGTRVEVSFPAA